MLHTRQTLIRRPTLSGPPAGRLEPIVYRRYSSLRHGLEIQETPSAKNGSSPPCHAQKGLHVQAGQPLRTSDAACAVSRRPFKNHGEHPNNNTNHPCSEAAILTLFVD